MSSTSSRSVMVKSGNSSSQGQLPLLSTSAHVLSPWGHVKGRSQLFRAVEDGNFWKVKYLAEKGVPLNVVGAVTPGMPPTLLGVALMIPHAKKRFRMFHCLIRLGADVLQRDDATGRDILLWAAFLNRAPEVKVVLDCDASIDIELSLTDKHGFSALHYAVLHDNSLMVEYLVGAMKKFGLSIDVKDPHGFTPYLHAVRKQYSACARILVELGGANRGARDDALFISDETWRMVAEREKMKKENNLRDKEAAIYKAMGRLPQLQAAGYDPTRMCIARKSKAESSLLKHLTKEDTVIRIRNNFHLEPLLYEDKASGFERHIRTERSDGNSPKKFSNIPQIILSSHDEVSTPTTSGDKMHPLRSSAPTLLSGSNDPNNHSSSLLSPIMTMYSEQHCDGFRTPAPKPVAKTLIEPPVEVKCTIGFGAALQLTRFAGMVRKKKLQKAAKKASLAVENPSVKKPKGDSPSGSRQSSSTSPLR